uniref:Uncharacterized protein n=1 Tax=Arundo donax TaxID=35708 RepID=A0A0A9GP09_ARUDO
MSKFYRIVHTPTYKYYTTRFGYFTTVLACITQSIGQAYYR